MAEILFNKYETKLIKQLKCRAPHGVANSYLPKQKASMCRIIVRPVFVTYIAEIRAEPPGPKLFCEAPKRRLYDQ